MARTNNKFVRVYIDGYDFSGMSRAIGPLSYDAGISEFVAFSDTVINGMSDVANVGTGTLDGVFDNTATTGFHTLQSNINGVSDVMVAIGFQAAPAIGDPAFIAQPQQAGYLAVPAGGIVTASVPYHNISNQADQLAYANPFGKLLHDLSAETAANSTTGEGVDHGAATSAGGYLMYQVTAGDGTATISIDDSADDSSYSALSGATSGEIDCSAVQSGVVALGTTATVKQYLRWQLALNTANTVTFALAFVRG